MVECYLCGELFEPNSEQVKAWGESGEDFEPTDWACPDCLEAEDEADEWDDDEGYPYEPQECPNCAGEDKDPEGILPHCPYCNHGVLQE